MPAEWRYCRNGFGLAIVSEYEGIFTVVTCNKAEDKIDPESIRHFESLPEAQAYIEEKYKQ